MKNRHLKLVVSNKGDIGGTNNDNIFVSLLESTKKFFTEVRTLSIPLPFSYIDKKKYILDYLVIKFADYQLSTGISPFFPMYEAIKAVEELEDKGKINSYYKKIKRRINL